MDKQEKRKKTQEFGSFLKMLNSTKRRGIGGSAETVAEIMVNESGPVLDQQGQDLSLPTRRRAA